MKKYIDTIHPYEIGKPIDEVKRELGLEEVFKLASNENSLGLSAKVKAAIVAALPTAHRYPDGAAWELRSVLAAHLHVPMEEIIIGNGSNEIIDFIARGYISEGDEVISSECAFLVYPLLTQVCGGTYVEVPMNNWRFDLDAIVNAITEKTKVIFIANPNNPTGTYVPKTELESFVARVPENVMICIDEAYYEYATAEDFLSGLVFRGKKNVVTFRTFSKAYGLAGLRVGYAVASPDVVTYLNKIRQPFNVNVLAQIAAIAILGDEEYVQASCEMNVNGKKLICSAFDDMGLTYIPSQTNFILVDVKVDAQSFFQNALKKGLVVRAMNAYKLNTYVRISIGTEDENLKAISVMRELIER